MDNHQNVTNSNKDFLTSLYSKNYFIKNITKMASKMVSEVSKGNSWSLLFCDIDGLKLTNETLGHLEADQGIKYLGKIINSSIRTHRKNKDKIIYPDKEGKRDDNIAFRFGGDEFIIILPNCDKEGAALIETRIKQKITENKEKTKNLTLSIGIADTNDVPQISNTDNISINFYANCLITLAEDRMFQNKHQAIMNLSEKEREILAFKQINLGLKRAGYNFELNDPKQIDLAINILKSIKKDK